MFRACCALWSGLPKAAADAADEADFVPTAAFGGARAGYCFKSGAQGLGYYRDTGAAAMGVIPPSYISGLVSSADNQTVKDLIRYLGVGDSGVAMLHASELVQSAKREDQLKYIDIQLRRAADELHALDSACSKLFRRRYLRVVLPAYALKPPALFPLVSPLLLSGTVDRTDDDVSTQLASTLNGMESALFAIVLGDHVALCSILRHLNGCEVARLAMHHRSIYRGAPLVSALSNLIECLPASCCDLPLPDVLSFRERLLHRYARLTGTRFAPSLFCGAVHDMALREQTDCDVSLAAIEKMFVVFGRSWCVWGLFKEETSPSPIHDDLWWQELGEIDMGARLGLSWGDLSWGSWGGTMSLCKFIEHCVTFESADNVTSMIYSYNKSCWHISLQHVDAALDSLCSQLRLQTLQHQMLIAEDAASDGDNSSDPTFAESNEASSISDAVSAASGLYIDEQIDLVQLDLKESGVDMPPTSEGCVCSDQCCHMPCGCFLIGHRRKARSRLSGARGALLEEVEALRVAPSVLPEDFSDLLLRKQTLFEDYSRFVRVLPRSSGSYMEYLQVCPPTYEGSSFLALQNERKPCAYRTYGDQVACALDERLRSHPSYMPVAENSDDGDEEEEREEETWPTSTNAALTSLTTASGAFAAADSTSSAAGNGFSNTTATAVSAVSTVASVSASSSIPSHLGLELVGQRVRVWWNGDDCWYPAWVSSFSSRRGHYLEYDEVTGEDDLSLWTDLTKERWEIQAGAHGRTTGSTGRSTSSSTSKHASHIAQTTSGTHLSAHNPRMGAPAIATGEDVAESATITAAVMPSTAAMTQPATLQLSPPTTNECITRPSPSLPPAVTNEHSAPPPPSLPPAATHRPSAPPQPPTVRPSRHDRVRVHLNDGREYTGQVIDTSEELGRKGRIMFRFRVQYDSDDFGSGGSTWHIHGIDGDVKSVDRLPPEDFGDVLADEWQPLSMQCILSLNRLTDPAKGTNCAHLACCNYGPLEKATSRLSRAKACPFAGCSCRISRSRDLVRDSSLAAKLAKVPATVPKVQVRTNGDVWWPTEANQSGDSCIDLTPDGDVLVMVDEQRQRYWAQLITAVKQEI